MQCKQTPNDMGRWVLQTTKTRTNHMAAFDLSCASFVSNNMLGPYY